MLDLHGISRSPVEIATIEVLRFDKWHFVRTTSTAGAVGIAVTNQRIPYLLPILKQLVIPFFLGRDARDLESLVDGVYTHKSNYKLAGLALWSCVGYVELSLLDMLGQVALKSVGELLGSVIRRRIPIYMSSSRRDTTPEQEVEWVGQRVAETGARAVKLKIGGRMSGNADASPGRTDCLVSLARETFGDDVAIYVDANGSYDADKAIEVGRLLEAKGMGFFEEPCPFDEYEQTRRVADALDLPVAGGEQDTSLARFRWMIRNRGVDLVQPDLIYNGGLIRCLRVARLAAEAGMQITPHCPRADPNTAYMLHFASVVPNLGPHQEYQAKPLPAQSWYSPSFAVREGMVDVPIGPGLGVDYDPAIWDRAEVL